MLARTADCESEGNAFYTSFLLTWIFTEVRSDVCDRFVDGAEFEAQDVEVGGLLGKDVWLLPAVDARDVPDDDHLLVVRVLSDTG